MQKLLTYIAAHHKLGPYFNHKGTIMLPRDIIHNAIDTQHNIVNGFKALIDMQAWFVNKAMDEAEKYTKYLTPVEAKNK
jgi:hypothetical protein